MADIEKMKKKLEEMKAKIKKAESQEAKKKRAVDTRKKILIGAAMLDMARSDEKAHHSLMTMLNFHLKRPQDRILFGLKPEPPQPKPQKPTDTPSADKNPPTGVK